jgi:hypothetical protein
MVEKTAAAQGGNAKRTGLDAQSTGYYLNASTADAAGRATQEILYFLDYHQPIYYEFPLPEGTYSADLIDPWEMKINPLPGKFTGKSKIRLTGTPYQAVRFRRV